jgi:hypothetical protein
MGGAGARTSYFIASVVQWKEKTLDVGDPSSTDFVYFWRSKQRSCDGWGGAQRPVWHGSELEKTGGRSARVGAAHGRARAAKTH